MQQEKIKIDNWLQAKDRIIKTYSHYKINKRFKLDEIKALYDVIFALSKTKIWPSYFSFSEYSAKYPISIGDERTYLEDDDGYSYGITSFEIDNYHTFKWFCQQLDKYHELTKE